MSCAATVSQAVATGTCTVSTMKVPYYDSKPGCSTESTNPPSPPGATGGATAAQPNYLDYLPPGGYGTVLVIKFKAYCLKCIKTAESAYFCQKIDA